jgi:hypothetical protein
MKGGWAAGPGLGEVAVDSPRTVTTAVLAAVAVLCLAVTLSSTDYPPHAVVWGGLALAAFALALLFRPGTRSYSGLGLAEWKIGPWLLLWYAIAFGLATVTWSQPVTGVAAEIEPSSVLRALWLVGVGLSAWMLGYLTGPGRLIRDRAGALMARLGGFFTVEVRGPLTPWLLYLMGVAGRLAATATTGRFGYVGDAAGAVTTATGYGQILSALSLCAPLGVAAAAIQVYREGRSSARITLIILFLAELVTGAAAAQKQIFVMAVLAVVIPFCASRRRMPVIVLAVSVLLFLAVVIPFTAAYRGTVRTRSGSLTPSQAVAAAPGIVRQAVAGQDALMIVPDSVDYLLQRIREIDSPAIIMQRTPGQIPFSSASQLITGPLAGMVPRALWPGKPIMVPGYQISQEYYELPPTVYTSSAITPVADLYRHGGWIPVLAGMFLLGCAIRLLDDTLDVRRNPHAIFLLLLVFPIIVKSESNWQALLASIPATLFAWLLAVVVTFRRAAR